MPSDPTSWMVTIHTAATLYMVGLIWFVQWVHYPLMGEVGREGFARYEALHTQRTTWVVGPPMLLELGATAWLCWQPPVGVSAGLPWLGAGLLALVWLATATLQVPAHGRLSGGFEADVHRRLVGSNWIRTVAWTLRGGIALAIAAAS